MFVNVCFVLGPGRPSAGGPRMDRQAVTSPGVVKMSRLASRLWRSTRRGPDPTAVLIKRLMKKSGNLGIWESAVYYGTFR